MKFYKTPIVLMLAITVNGFWTRGWFC